MTAPKIRKFIFIFPVVFIFLVSCSNEKLPKDFHNRELTTTTETSLMSNINLNNIDKVLDTLNFSKKIYYYDRTNNDIFRKNQFYREFFSSKLDKIILKNRVNNLSVIGLSIFTDKRDEIAGVGLYCSYPNENEVLYHLFTVYDSVIDKVDDFPKRVNNILSQDLVYVALSHFRQASISLIMDSPVEAFRGISYGYNDLALARTTTNIFAPDNSLVYDGVHGSDGCGWTIACIHGSGIACAPYAGCYDPCEYSAISTTISNYAQNNNINVDFSSKLSASKLYSLNNEVLLSSSGGKKISNLYYAINNHFFDSFNAGVLLETLQITPETSMVIDRLNDGNYNGVIFNDTFMNHVETLLNTSVANSTSQEYSEVIPLLLEKLDEYKNLTRSEFIQKLQNE